MRAVPTAPASLPPTTPPPRGRYAPSPTGLLHVGNARTALVAWLSVRARGGTFVWRVEDLDPPRQLAGAADAAAFDLAWMGLDWDEDPDAGGPFAPYVQSARRDVYEAALQSLHDSGRLFPCRLSRRELATIASAPHAGEGDETPYPATARPSSLTPHWYERLRAGDDDGAALRFRVDERPVRFVDRVQGPIEEHVGRTCGDFVLKRRDGLYAYQLAVAVDDWTMRIDEVVRGADLLTSTARQIQLLEALGAQRPAWAHVPMVLDPEGERLSKRHGSLTLRALREAGVRPEQLVGLLAWSLGLLETPAACRASDLLAAFAWSRIGKDDWRLPADFVERLRALR